MSDQILSLEDIVLAVKPLAEKYKIKDVFMFGSYARNEATKDSDLDFLVYGSEEFKPTHIFSFAEDLRKETQKSVDAYEIREVNMDSDFYRTIVKEGVHIA